MATTEIRRVPADDDDRPERKPSAPRLENPKRKHLLALAAYYAVITKRSLTTHVGSMDMRTLARLYDQYGDQLEVIIKKAWEKREELLSEKFPVFTLWTVEFFAKFKYVVEPVRPALDYIQISLEQSTRNGITDPVKLARILTMRGLQESDLHGHITDSSLRQQVLSEISNIRVS